MTARLLVVGLDAADGALLDEMSRSGELPQLARLRRGGHFHRLPDSDALSDDALWASFQYGLPLGEHGRHFYRVRKPRGGERRPYRQEDSARAFWHDLAREGRRVAIFDIPKCAPPAAFDGIHLTDWLAHGRYSTTPSSHPAELAAEVLARFGPPPPSRCGYLQRQLDDDDIREVTANLLLSVERKRAAALHYLDARHWDLFIVGFKETHCAGHGLWHLVDPRHAEHDPEADARNGHPVRRIYRASDAAIGALAEAAGPDAEIIVFSTSDIRPNGSVRHLQPALEERLAHELAHRSEEPRFGLSSLWPARRRHNRLPPIRLVPSNENVVAFDLAVPEGPAVTRQLDAAEALLRDLVDPATGERAFIRFSRPSRTEAGAQASGLPDLVAHCRPNAFPAALESAALGRIEAPCERMRPGNHLGGGAVFAAGARVEAGAPGLQGMQDFAGLIAAALREPERLAAE